MSAENQHLRDPRIDPRPGDEIARQIPRALQGVILRKVTRAHGGFVFCMRDNGFVARPEIMSLEKWRTLAVGSEVVELAGEIA